MAHVTALTLLLASALFSALHRLLIRQAMDQLVLIAGFNLISIAVGAVLIFFVPPLPLSSLPYLLAASFFYSVAMFFLCKALRHADFSVIVPLQGALKVVVMAFLATLTLGEEASVIHWVAVTLIFVSFAIQVHPIAAIRTHQVVTLLLAFAFGVTSGMQYIADAAGVRSVEYPLTYIAWNLLIGLPIVVYAVARRGRLILDEFGRQKARISLAAVLDLLGYAFILYVVHDLAMLDILPIIHLDILFATLIGLFLLSEKEPARRILASGLLLCSAVLVEAA